MKEIDKWLEQFRKLWENRFTQLDAVLTKLKNKKSKRLFSRTARKTNKKNVQGRPMRGGIRL